MIKKTLLLAAVASLFTMTACAQKSEKKENAKMEEKALVVYFSATGTTKAVAEKIASVKGADIYEIQPKQKYSTADLDWTVKTSRSCIENANPNVRPEIVKGNINIGNYGVVYVGYPIWWDMAPRVVNTFIESYDLKGTTIIPFATSGGSGIENSVKVLREIYPALNIKDGKLINNPTNKNIENL